MAAVVALAREMAGDRMKARAFIFFSLGVMWAHVILEWWRG